LDRILFAQTLATTPHLFSSGLFGMVYEHLSGCFIPKDPSSRFSRLFHATIVVAYGDIPRSMARMLGVNKLLAMAKDIGGFCPTVIGKMFFRLISHSIVLQF
jgi:hypothetical protein